MVLLPWIQAKDDIPGRDAAAIGDYAGNIVLPGILNESSIR
jgi:hypothetical protein